MKIICFKSKTTFSLLLAAGLLSFSCSKDKAIIDKPIQKEYTQHFEAVIAGKSVAIENTISKDRDILSGQWTGIGMSDGSAKSLYNVLVRLPKGLLDNNLEPVLRFQIDNIQIGYFNITGINDRYENLEGSHIVLSAWGKNGNSEDAVVYTANPDKKPFGLEITRYEYLSGSTIPIVGGKLSGVLYNEEDVQDSITIRNGVFEVRY